MKNLFRFISLLLFLCFYCNLLCGQSKLSTDVPGTESIEAIVAEVLEIISGEPGEKRDLDTFQKLFVPEARFTILTHAELDNVGSYESVSLAEFVEILQDSYYEDGFKEVELVKHIDQYNGIAQVFQSFYAVDSKGEGGRGITSYQLLFAQHRWWILNILWTTDSNGAELPLEYQGQKP